ncbi:MAG: hypothetical protein LBC65_03425, partial [Oscillospiraceae bacterium]|nr:hypothetical protein [Oscillospiraceae bacterium]
MRIQNNITALNSHRQYGINNASIAKNVEKLSSGYKINRAGDDAAGLAISEKMRAQVRGLNMASKNAQDGVSLIQTAEGGLQSGQNILQRMRELTVQAANDTNVQLDRKAISLEIQELTEEIDRTAYTTSFNTRTLLDGSLASGVTKDLLTGVDADRVTQFDAGRLSTATAEDITLTAGTKATNELTLTAAPDVTKSYKVSYGSESIDVALATGDTANSAAVKIADAINAKWGNVVEASGTATAGTVTLTAKTVGAVEGAHINGFVIDESDPQGTAGSIVTNNYTGGDDAVAAGGIAAGGTTVTWTAQTNTDGSVTFTDNEFQDASFTISKEAAEIGGVFTIPKSDETAGTGSLSLQVG